PMIDLSVVVLPAPLRPSKVTTSPGSTSKVTPCRMWDSPYHACRPSTASSGAASLMAGPHVGFAYLRVGRHRGVVAFGEHAPAREHGDGVREVGDHGKVMLDHEHGAIGGSGFDQRGDAVDVFVPHAGGRLVEQHHFRIERERGGKLERALAPVREF